MADPKPRRTYSPEEVNAILSRAIERQSTSDLSHEDLEAAAQEVGVSAEALEQAAHEVTAQRIETQETYPPRHLHRDADHGDDDTHAPWLSSV